MGKPFYFCLPTNLVRLRMDEIDTESQLSLKFLQSLIKDLSPSFFILSREISSVTKKLHYHICMDLNITVRRLRQRVKAFFDSHNSANMSSISDQFEVSAKYAAQAKMLKDEGIDYRHYHCYYICKDSDIIDYLAPIKLALLKSGYHELKAKLPSSVKDYYVKKESKVAKPNYTKVLLDAFQKQPNFEKIPVTDREKYEKKLQILHFVMNQMSGFNQDHNEHLGKCMDNHTVLKLSQTIFNTFYGTAEISTIMDKWVNF